MTGDPMPMPGEAWTATRYAPTASDGRRPPLVIEDRGRGWAITDGHACLNRDGFWEIERPPGSRDEACLARTRYALEEAIAVAEAWLARHEPWRGGWRDRPHPP